MEISGHPSTHGHHINPWTCGDRQHAACSGFSGGYDTYVCGCCCHDADLGYELTEQDLRIIRRMRGEPVDGGPDLAPRPVDSAPVTVQEVDDRPVAGVLPLHRPARHDLPWAGE